MLDQFLLLAATLYSVLVSQAIPGGHLSQMGSKVSLQYGSVRDTRQSHYPKKQGHYTFQSYSRNG